ncbi:MFS transporter [Parvularcula dongshanensis]|uniref:PAT family beta-lactamase induction signal transducer AmpG n=1 Tax=Parvularcula dongshanensis TaxID=1173995 RepID=A0A840I797_9PROT|nr:MFS transporter [Parvularcula dongshanensis]MBB4659978.1 PAT family beta-lactamase induction signal transducer AmpG [Parvularcula dongshanensis]
MSATEPMTPAASLPAFRLGAKPAMAVLGFASGLPYAVFTGTIIAWFTAYDVDAKSIGVFSMSSLPYVFKFLWSPLLGAYSPPGAGRLRGVSRLRSWILVSLALITPVLFLLPNLDPTRSLGLVAFLSLIAIFASATQDIAIGGWRIRIAKDEAELNSLVSIEQFSYRTASFFGAAVAFVIAQNASWDAAWWAIAGLVGVCFALVFFVPDPAMDEAEDTETPIALGGSLSSAERRRFLLPVIAAWGLSLVLVFAFMFYNLNKEAVDAVIGREIIGVRDFTLNVGPVIVAACLLAPVLAAIGVIRRTGPSLGTQAPGQGVSDMLYRNLLEPFIDLVTRFRFALIPILFLTLFYRYADGVWGAFAYPFYLGAPENNGGLGHTLIEVAAASKTFGVLMTLAGVAVGGAMLKLIGQMPALVVGAVLAAATNLLYADLAVDARYTDAFIAFVHLDVLFPFINAVVNLLAADPVEIGPRLGRLMVVIAAENLAVGIASVVYVAYLSSLVNKAYAAVQYAILASLSLLVAVLGRGLLGELIDERGFAYVFVLTAVLGLLGVAGSVIEWVRRGRAAPRPD